MKPPYRVCNLIAVIPASIVMAFLGVGVAGADDRDLVLHAGGTVEFRVPVGWEVHEVPFGREVRLLVRPRPVANDSDNLRRGIWLAMHASDDVDPTDDVTWQNRLNHRLNATTDGRARYVGGPQKTHTVNTICWRRMFELPADPTRADGRPTLLRGYHLIAPVSWGWLEFHAIAPGEHVDAVMANAQSLLATLKLARPLPSVTPRHPAVAAAAPIVGTWKALDSRLMFDPDGRVVIQFDRGASFAIDEQGSLVFDRTVTLLSGRYEAHGDVLFVTWDDGSRVNYRWSVRASDLLLTSHAGHVSQLKRLFD